MTNWYVITGGPCAGKTTLLQELERRGYRVVLEAARSLIEEELGKGRTLAEIRKDEAEFQRDVLAMKIEIEARLPKDEMLFLDRGMHDSAAYYEIVGGEDERLEGAVRNASYRKVFLLELLPFSSDNVRVENAETAKRLQGLLKEGYSSSGIEVIDVPVMPVTERADFVLSRL